MEMPTRLPSRGAVHHDLSSDGMVRTNGGHSTTARTCEDYIKSPKAAELNLVEDKEATPMNAQI